MDLKSFKLYALYDIKLDDLDVQEDKELYNPKHQQGQIEVSEDLDELDKWNFYEHYGIFHTVNEYSGDRKKETLTRVNYWYCDIDQKNFTTEKPKLDMLKSIAKCKKRPTNIIETKNGFHCYWKLKNPIIVTDNNRDEVNKRFSELEKAIIQRFNGDMAVSHSVALLRYPCRLHWKKPTDPYVIRYLFDDFVNDYWDFNPENPDSKYKLQGRTDLTYTEDEMRAYFIEPEKVVEIQRSNRVYSEEKPDFFNKDKWDDLFGLPTGIPKIINGKIIRDKNNKIVYKKSLSLIGDGNRNNNLARITMWLQDEHLSNQDIEYIVRELNNRYIAPSLPDREVTQILRGKGIYV